jgi:lysophospholipase L1-like esterase
MQAFRWIADYAASRGWEMTILLWPRKPITLSEKARATTLPAFAQLVRNFAEPRRIRVVDLTTTSPIGDDDYMEDFDHFNAGGNAKFAPWALDHDLSFLASAPAEGSAALAAVRE